MSSPLAVDILPPLGTVSRGRDCPFLVPWNIVSHRRFCSGDYEMETCPERSRRKRRLVLYGKSLILRTIWLSLQQCSPLDYFLAVAVTNSN